MIVSYRCFNKRSKMPSAIASGGIYRQRFKRGSRRLPVSRTFGPTNLPDTTSLAVSGRPQNAIKYCTKCVKWARHFCADIQADRLYSHTVYDVTSCFRLALMEVRKNGHLRRLWVEFLEYNLSVTKVCPFIANSQAHNLAGCDVTSCSSR